MILKLIIYLFVMFCRIILWWSWSTRCTCRISRVDSSLSVFVRRSVWLLSVWWICLWCMVVIMVRSWWLFVLWSMWWRLFICLLIKIRCKWSSTLLFTLVRAKTWCELVLWVWFVVKWLIFFCFVVWIKLFICWLLVFVNLFFVTLRRLSSVWSTSWLTSLSSRVIFMWLRRRMNWNVLWRLIDKGWIFLVLEIIVYILV